MERDEEPQRFRRHLLEGYRAIVEPGRYELAVLTNVDNRHIIKDQHDRDIYIVNFKAMAPDQTKKIVELFGSNDSIPLKDTSGLFLTGTFLRSETSEKNLPMRGQRLEALVDWVQDKDKSSKVLRVVATKLPEIKEAGYISVAELFRLKEEDHKGELDEIVHNFK